MEKDKMTDHPMAEAMDEKNGSPEIPSLADFIVVCKKAGGELHGGEFFAGETEKPVLLVSHELSLTGAPVVLLYMAQTLRALGMRPIVVSPKDGPLCKDFSDGGIPVLTVPALFETDLISGAAGLFAFVVLNTAASAPVADRLNGTDTPVLWWMHEAEAYYGSVSDREMPYYLFPNILVVTPGPLAKRHLLARRPYYRPKELLYWLPDAAADGCPKGFELSPMAEGKLVFALVGSVEPRKGQDILLETMDLLSEDVAERCFFVFVGQEYQPELAGRIREAAADRPEMLQYLPQIERERMPDFYAVIDCLICASRDDPMPVVVTEACQFSKIVICSENTGCAPLLEGHDAGLLYRGDDSEALARCILRVCGGKDGEFDALRCRAREVYQKYFSSETFEARLREEILPWAERTIKGDGNNVWNQLSYGKEEAERFILVCERQRKETVQMGRAIDDKERHIRNLEAAAVGHSAKIQEQTVIIADKERHIRNLETQIQDQRGAIADRENRIRSLSSQIRAQAAQCEQRDKLIAAQSERLSHLDRQLAEANAREEKQVETLRVMGAELAHYKEHYFAAINQREELKRQLAQAQYAYDVISNAGFWKITKPFRWTLDGIKAMCRRSAFLRFAGKGWHSLRENGFRDTWHRVGNKFRHRHDFALATRPLFTAEQIASQRGEVFPRDILFSILVPLYNTRETFLHEMICSVLDQTYGRWELCLADGSDEKHADVGRLCRQYAARDSRIRYQKLEKNMGISGNTNACIDMARGEYIALFDHDDILHPAALHEVMKAICEQDADFVYTDENTFHKKPEDAYMPHFKPDFAPDTLRSNNYICHFTVFKRSLLDEVGLFDSECDGSQDHDMVLRLTEKAKHVIHIPEILYYWRAHAGSVAQEIGAKSYAINAGIRAVNKSIQRMGLEGNISTVLDGTAIYRIRYALRGTPKVSILIPNCEHLKDLQTCLDSIYEKTTYPDFEIVIVENNSSAKEVFQYYEEIQKQHDDLRVVIWKGSFNYSSINNYGVRFCSGEYILLLNNDTEVISPDWLQEMLMFAQRPDVGAVGAKLYYPNDTIQHAGVILGMGGVAGHCFKNVDRHHVGYMGRLIYAQNLSAVTAACLMMRRSVWDEIGGLDASFAVAFNDMDLCMRIRKAGYLIVWTPFAELYHYESKSRGIEDTPEKQMRFAGEVNRFQTRWAKELAAGDPYYNPNLTLERPDFSLRRE